MPWAPYFFGDKGTKKTLLVSIFLFFGFFGASGYPLSGSAQMVRIGRTSGRGLRGTISKPQIVFERRTLSVRRFSMPARSPAPASGGPRRMARTSVLPEAKPWIGADSFRPNRMKIGDPRPAGRAGRNFAGEIAKQLGKQTADWLRAPDAQCPALFRDSGFCLVQGDCA